MAASLARHGLTWNRELEFPSTVVAKVADLPVPLPVDRDEFALDLGAVRAVLVERVAEQTAGRTVLRHVDREAVDFAVTEAVAREEIVRGSVASVFHLALHPDINASGTDVLGVGVIRAVGLGVFQIAAVDFPFGVIVCTCSIRRMKRDELRI